MAIISCPQCGKKISSMAVMCLHCGFQRGDISDQQSLLLRQRRARDRVYHLSMISYAITAFFLAGFGWFWWGTSGFQHAPPRGPYLLMGLSALAYLAVRIVLFQAKRRYQELKRLKF